jgi:N-acetylglucosaminyldiphosphoundecaprenol N-acetyl-beta-D-mannosaminyltransferase
MTRDNIDKSAELSVDQEVRTNSPFDPSKFGTPKHAHSIEGEVFFLRAGKVTLQSASAEYVFSGEPDRFKHIVTVNAEIFVIAHENQIMADILAGTTNTIDGRILQWLCHLSYGRTDLIRLAGADLIYDLTAFCQRRTERLFLLGAAPATLDKALKALRALYPNAQIEGYSPPIAPYPFADSINRDILEKVEKFRPHHVVVCFGPLKQERWIRDNSSALADLGVRRAYGFGGTIDFVASTQRRAPRILQQVGLEWLFRAILEPRKRLRRTLTMFRMPYYMAMTKRAIREVRVAEPSDAIST